MCNYCFGGTHTQKKKREKHTFKIKKPLKFLNGKQNDPLKTEHKNSEHNKDNCQM